MNCSSNPNSSLQSIETQQSENPPELPKEGEFWILRDSGIHGKGMFSRTVIPKGAKIIEYIGEKISKAESTRRGLALHEESLVTGGAAVYIFYLNKKFDLDGNIPSNPSRLMNHSCQPNCEAIQTRGRIWIHAVRTIQEGEELTYDYGFELEHWKDHPCRCGTSKCVGYIVRKGSRRTLLKKIAEQSK
jgi:uncharacterized protein